MNGLLRTRHAVPQLRNYRSVNGEPGKHTFHDPSRRAVVLIIVLVLVVMVSLAGFGFLSAMSIEYEAARLNGSLRQAKQTLASGESLILWMTGLPEEQRELMGGLYHNPALFRGRVVKPLSLAGSGPSPLVVPSDPSDSLRPDSSPLQGQGSADAEWRFSLATVDAPPDQTRVLRFGLNNESRKLNLAALLRWELASPGQGRRSLMQLPGMTEAIADCLLDWCDADDVPREFGAESEYYQTLDRPYRAANAVPQSLTELLYVKGTTRHLLTGTGGVRSEHDGSLLPSPMEATLVPEGPEGSDDFSAGSHDGWLQYLTTSSAERDQSRSGKPRVFLNAGSLAELQKELSLVLPENMVRYILLARIHGLTISAEPLATTDSGSEPGLAPFAITTPPAFSIGSVADLLDSTVIITTASGPMVIRSPLHSTSPESEALARAVFDSTTTHSEQVLYGRIHLETASEVVLNTIPGLTPEVTAQIVTTRDSLESGESNSLLWLLSRNVLDIATFRKVFPEITTGGDVFEAELIVHRAIGGPLLRRKVIVDAASFPPRRLHWNNLTDLPLEFPLQMLLPAPVP